MAVDDGHNHYDAVMYRLEFDSIAASFAGRDVLKSVYMFSETGQITGLLGRNGSGKSTLLKIVFGSMPLEQKSIRINGNSLGLHYLAQRRIAYLPQGNLIPSYLSIGKAIELFDIVPDKLIMLFPELAELLHLRPSQLSGGYLRLLEMLLVLESKADFCLLDEPFTGLTPVYIERIKEILLIARRTKGIILTDHLYRHVAEVSDKLYLLVNGQTYQIRNEEQLISFGYVSRL